MEFLCCASVGVKVISGGVEEVSSETIVGVEKDTVGVVVELGGDILDEELDLVDGVCAALGSLE